MLSRSKILHFVALERTIKMGLPKLALKFLPLVLGYCCYMLSVSGLKPITTMLWLFALLDFICTQNHFNFDKSGQSPYMKFALVDLLPTFGDQHPWGYLV